MELHYVQLQQQSLRDEHRYRLTHLVSLGRLRLWVSGGFWLVVHARRECRFANGVTGTRMDDGRMVDVGWGFAAEWQCYPLPMLSSDSKWRATQLQCMIHVLCQSAAGSSHWQQSEKVVIQPTPKTDLQGVVAPRHQVAELRELFYVVF